MRVWIQTLFTVSDSNILKKLNEFVLKVLEFSFYQRAWILVCCVDLQSSRSHAIFTLYIQQQRQSRRERPFGEDVDQLGRMWRHFNIMNSFRL